MKKLLLCVALLALIATFVWSGGMNESGSSHVSFTGTYGFTYESVSDASGIPGLTAELAGHSFAPGFTLFRTYANSPWSYYFDFAYEVPVAQSVKLSDSTDATDWLEVDLDAFDKIYYMDIEMGGLYSIIKSLNTHVAVGPVVTVQSFYSNQIDGYSNYVVYFGAGAHLEAMYFLNNMFFLRAGASLTVNPIITDFYDTDSVFNIGFDPSIGIGIRY